MGEGRRIIERIKSTIVTVSANLTNREQGQVIRRSAVWCSNVIAYREVSSRMTRFASSDGSLITASGLAQAAIVFMPLTAHAEEIGVARGSNAHFFYLDGERQCAWAATVWCDDAGDDRRVNPSAARVTHSRGDSRPTRYLY